MTTELYWLTLTILLTAIMWVPYVLNMIGVYGMSDALGYPEVAKPLAPWAERLKKAHYNAVENLVVFGLLVVIAHLADVHSGLTVTACVVYFFARLAHAIVYALGIPVLRTVTFAISWLCSLIMALAVLF